MAENREDFVDILALNEDSFQGLSDQSFAAVVGKLAQTLDKDTKENQLRFYQPVSPKAQRVHESTARLVGVFGGNGSSKTETMIVEAVMRVTGVFPDALKHMARQKFRGPINARIVCQSLTTVLYPTILPKLQWYKWTGVGEQGIGKGHWGWIPRRCLIDGSWEKSWSTALRTLTVLCYDPWSEECVGQSILQFMSHDQEASDMASGDFKFVGLDEPPPKPAFTENQARTMRVAGTLMLAMTWPDDGTINVDYVHDEVYEKGMPGPYKVDGVECVELHTTENKHLDQQSVQDQIRLWGGADSDKAKVRIYGSSIRFANLIHPLFTDTPRYWSPARQSTVSPDEQGLCPLSGGEVWPFCHVQEFDPHPRWPVVFLLDPHPRKPHMGIWVQVDPNDDYWQVDDFELAEGCDGVWRYVQQRELELGLNVVRRVGDPNMLAAPATSHRRDNGRAPTWQEEFADAGLHIELGKDADVGRGRVNDYLAPDELTKRPRLIIHKRCEATTFQFKRYVWDDHKIGDNRDIKQKPRPKNDDFPTLWKYLMNERWDFGDLQAGPVVIGAGRRTGTYGEQGFAARARR